MPLRAEASLRLSPSCRFTASTGELLDTLLHLLPRMGRRGCSAGLRGGQSTDPLSGEVPWCAGDQGPPGLETSCASPASVALTPAHTLRSNNISSHASDRLTSSEGPAQPALRTAARNFENQRPIVPANPPNLTGSLCCAEVSREAHRVLAQWVPVHPTLLSTAVPSCPLHSPWLSASLGTRSP